MTEVKLELAAKKGVKETKDALAFVFALAKIFKMAKQNDGVVNAQDLVLVASAIPLLGPTLEGATEIPAELKDLDMEEIKELLVYSAAHLGENSNNPELTLKLEKGLAAVLAILEFVKVVK